MNKYLDNFITELTQIKNKKEMESFLKCFLSPSELESIPKRLEIVKMLKKGIPQAKIAKELSVGIATVTRGAMELKRHQQNN